MIKNLCAVVRDSNRLTRGEFYHLWCVRTSVVDPNILNIDPDPGLYHQFLKKNSKKNVRENIYLLNYKKKCKFLDI